MRLDRPLVNAIIASKPPGIELGEWIAHQSGLIEGIRSRLAACRKSREAIHRDYLAAVESVDCEIRKARGECPHYAMKYYADPCGGTDSHRECDLCGEVWR
jgi:hypothetical protein